MTRSSRRSLPGRAPPCSLRRAASSIRPPSRESPDLVASAVEGLGLSATSRSPTEPARCSWPAQGGGGANATTKLAAEQLYSAQLGAQITSMLDSTLGPNKALARVQADIDVDQTVSDETFYAKKGTPLLEADEPGDAREHGRRRGRTLRCRGHGDGCLGCRKPLELPESVRHDGLRRRQDRPADGCRPRRRERAPCRARARLLRSEGGRGHEHQAVGRGASPGSVPKRGDTLSVTCRSTSRRSLRPGHDGGADLGRRQPHGESDRPRQVRSARARVAHLPLLDDAQPEAARARRRRRRADLASRDPAVGCRSRASSRPPRAPSS